jgi:excisionase family DNA binding protein
MAAPLLDSPTPAGSVLDGERRVQLPLDEAALLLGISKWLAYKLAHAGELPTNRIGRNLYVPLSVLRRAERGQPLTDGGAVA